MNIQAGSAGAAAGRVTQTYLQKRFPYISRYKYSDVELQEIELRFAKWKVLTVVLVFVYIFGLPFVYGFLLSKFYDVYYSVVIASSETFYRLTSFLFGLSGILLAIATLKWSLEWTQRLFLGDDFDRFEDYYNHSQGYDNGKAAFLLFKVFIVLALVSLPFTFGTRIILDNNSITKRKLVDITATTYEYQDLKAIVLYQKSQNREGELVDNRHYVLYFKDGESMNLNFYFDGAQASERFVRDLSSRAALKILDIEVDRY